MIVSLTHPSSKAKEKLRDLELDDASAKKAVIEAKRFMIQCRADGAEFLDLLQTNIHDPEMELVSIQTATHVLRLLVHHSSITVKLAAEKLPGPKTAEFTYSVAGAGLSASAIVGGAAVVFAPVALPLCVVGLGVYCCGLLTIYDTASNANDKRKEMTKTKNLCNEGKQIHSS